jgi:hypothetical protein
MVVLTIVCQQVADSGCHLLWALTTHGQPHHTHTP